MSALLDSLATAFDGDAARRAVLDAALQAGLPGARNEAWKYTSLRALERRSFATAPHVVPAIESLALAHIPAPRLVFVNGRYSAGLSDFGDLPAGVLFSASDEAAPLHRDDADVQADVFADLNLALANEGALLQVDAGVQVEAPVHLVFAGTASAADAAWHLRNRIAVGERARLTVVEHHLCARAHANLANSVLTVALADHAQLLHARVQGESAQATLFSRTQATLGEGADYQRFDLELGAALSRHVLDVRLQGRDCKLLSRGVLLATGRQHLDTRLAIGHVARDTRCDLLWRGLASGRGRGVFHGGIVIHAGADGSDARLSNKNLLLGDNAEIDTQPVLEIHADEVKAAHGATVGQLDPTALFYLRSRGLVEADARRLLTAAFCHEAISGVESPVLRTLLADALDHALDRLDTP